MEHNSFNAIDLEGYARLIRRLESIAMACTMRQERSEDPAEALAFRDACVSINDALRDERVVHMLAPLYWSTHCIERGAPCAC